MLLMQTNLLKTLLARLDIAKGGYKYVLAASTTTGKNLLPRVAALLDVSMITDIIAVESANTFKRPIYAGNAILQLFNLTKQLSLVQFVVLHLMRLLLKVVLLQLKLLLKQTMLVFLSLLAKKSLNLIVQN